MRPGKDPVDSDPPEDGCRQNAAVQRPSLAPAHPRLTGPPLKLLTACAGLAVINLALAACGSGDQAAASPTASGVTPPSSESVAIAFAQSQTCTEATKYLVSHTHVPGDAGFEFWPCDSSADDDWNAYHYLGGAGCVVVHGPGASETPMPWNSSVQVTEVTLRCNAAHPGTAPDGEVYTTGPIGFQLVEEDGQWKVIAYG